MRAARWTACTHCRSRTPFGDPHQKPRNTHPRRHCRRSPRSPDSPAPGCSLRRAVRSAPRGRSKAHHDLHCWRQTTVQMVKPLERSVVLALIYLVGSVLVGPAIYLGGYAFFTHGVMDYCDAVHGDKASSEAKFAAAQSFQVTGACTMLAVGLILLAHLGAQHHRISRLRLVSSSCGILVMMCGFGFLIWVSGPAEQSCWPGEHHAM